MMLKMSNIFVGLVTITLCGCIPASSDNENETFSHIPIESNEKIPDARNNIPVKVNTKNWALYEKPIPGIEYVKTDEDLIRKYYSLLNSYNLEMAYRLKVDGENPFSTFISWYENVIEIETQNIEKIAPYRYQFKVIMQERDTREKRYNVIMDVDLKGRKLKTISSAEIFEEKSYEIAFNHSTKTYIHWNRGTKTVVVEIEGNKNIVDEITTPKNIGRHFSKPQFSQRGRYLLYRDSEAGGWIVQVYDISNKKLLPVTSFAPSDYGITNDEKFFYVCQGTGMDSGYFHVFSLPNAKKTEEIVGPEITECIGYDIKSNEYKYSTWSKEKGETPYSYSFINEN